jgi:hypothetical protein
MSLPSADNTDIPGEDNAQQNSMVTVDKDEDGLEDT